MNEQYKPDNTDWYDTNGQFILRLKHKTYLALIDKNKDTYYSSSAGFPEVTVNELMMAAYLAGRNQVKTEAKEQRSAIVEDLVQHLREFVDSYE